MKPAIKYFSLAIILALFGLACSKDNDSEPDMATLAFAFDFHVDGESLELGKDYTINGTTVSFDVANFYIGGIELEQANGTTIGLQNQYLLAGLDNTATLNGEIEVSDISKARFFVGVDPTTNSQSETDFTSRPSNDPLGIQDPAMHWNWNTGYKFLRMDGNTDTDGDGVTETGVAYHLGSDPMLKNFDLTTQIDLEGGENTLTFSFDLATFFTGVDLSTELDTHTGNNLPLAELLHENLGNALTLE